MLHRDMQILTLVDTSFLHIPNRRCFDDVGNFGTLDGFVLLIEDGIERKEEGSVVSWRYRYKDCSGRVQNALKRSVFCYVAMTVESV